jgi:deazaflavin-dependent oxidoreductase (nitroreductase family)
MAQPTPPRRRCALRLLFRFINSVVGSILRSPLHRLLSGRLALLTFYGRKSGRRYTTPVGYGRTDDALLVDTESPWWRNLREDGARVGVRLQGRDRTGTAEVITDEARMREAYRIILAATPGYARALGVSLGSDGLPRRDDVARIRQKGHVVVRIELDP